MIAKPPSSPSSTDDLLGRVAVFLVLGHLKADRRRLDPQRPEQFEIAIDHVGRLGVDPLVVEPLAQFAAAGVAEADPPLGAGEPCQDGRLRQALHVDGHVELQVAQPAAQSPHAAGRLQPAARQFDQFVERFMSSQQRRRPRFDRPGQKRLGKPLAQRAGDRHRLDRVADRAEADDQDAG